MPPSIFVVADSLFSTGFDSSAIRKCYPFPELHQRLRAVPRRSDSAPRRKPPLCRDSVRSRAPAHHADRISKARDCGVGSMFRLRPSRYIVMRYNSCIGEMPLDGRRISRNVVRPLKLTWLELQFRPRLGSNFFAAKFAEMSFFTLFPSAKRFLQAFDTAGLNGCLP